LPRGRGGPANRARWANRGAGAQYGIPPAPPPGGLSCGPPYPVESRPGGVARGVGLRGPGVRAPVPTQGLRKRR